MATNNNTTKTAQDAVPVGHIPNYEKFTIDNIIDRLWNLYHLVDAASVDLSKRPFRRPDGGRDHELDRISSLVAVARERTRELHNDLVDRYDEIDDTLGEPDKQVAA